MLLDKFEEALKNCFEKSTFLKMGNLEALSIKLQEHKAKQNKNAFGAKVKNLSALSDTNTVTNDKALMGPMEQWWEEAEQTNDTSAPSVDCFVEEEVLQAEH